ncbi:uncharacterized protein LOC142357506 [Convolutriloba macropyga]|uniref:uncharacterized protein LOC142357506 n=1 Tax=Convolutriloba macropyga TaxID=536237 RepID=UPI003F51AFCA
MVNSVLFTLVMVQLLAKFGLGANPRTVACPRGMEHVSGATPGSCYSHRPFAMGIVTYHSAKQFCQQDGNSPVALVTQPRTLDELKAITAWAIDKGLPRNAEYGAGFWTGYQRFGPPVHVDEDHPYTSHVRDVRANKNLFRADYLHFNTPKELWRYNQPGDSKLQDERCTAQKKPHLSRYVGIDDFQCHGGHYHFVICEVSLDFLEKKQQEQMTIQQPIYTF